MLASPNYMFTIPGIVLTVLGIVILAMALPSDSITIGDQTWQPVFAGSICVVVGFNAFILGFASRLYTSARGITNEDSFTRFYSKYLSLEVFVVIGLALIAAGIILDVGLLVSGEAGINRIGLAAVAQTLIVVGANAGLVGALAALLENRHG
jgi:hypothetical protein